MATANVVLAGTVVRVLPEQKVSDSFKKRLIVIRIDEDTDYPQTVTVEFVNDKCQYLSKYSPGDYVTIDVNIRGKDFIKDGETINFTKMNGWRIKGNASGGAASADDMPGSEPEPQSPAPAGDEGPDDLPF